MVRKHYYLTGPSFTMSTTTNANDTMNLTFENPRALSNVTISHAGFTLDDSGTPGQLHLRSDALAKHTESRAREVDSAGKETQSNILGHVTLHHESHYELSRPVNLSFGNFKHKMAAIDFYLTDSAGIIVPQKMQVTASITRYDFAGAWTFQPWSEAVNFTQTWGPSEAGGTGGAVDLPGELPSTWSYNYGTNKMTLKWENNANTKIIADWDPANARFTFASETWDGLYFANATVNLVPDSVVYAWTQDNQYDGEIQGTVTSTWSYDPSNEIVTVLWGGDAAVWYAMEVDSSDTTRLIAVGDYAGIHAVGTVMWQLPSGSDYATSESGFSFSAGDPVFTYDDYTNNGNKVPTSEETTEQFPYASMQMTIDAVH